MSGDGWVYLSDVRIVEERIPAERPFPFSLPFVEGLALRFSTPVTFFVGENGAGKSTLLEALAVSCRFPVSGGGRNELGGAHGPEEDSALSRALRLSMRRHPRDGYFFRAEFEAHFASLLDARAKDPWFIGDPYARYGGGSLHARSHGEAFLDIIGNRVGEGLYFLDEPESALSPQRQLGLLAIMSDLVGAGASQFVIATHSPILLTFPGATIVSFDDARLPRVELRETSHYQITRRMLEAPERYWGYLRGE